jgi:Lar family restriction alleviation protein
VLYVDNKRGEPVCPECLKDGSDLVARAVEKAEREIAMSRESLKPCPFCGGEAQLREAEDGANDGGLYAACVECEASTRLWFAIKEEVEGQVVEAWNQRAASPRGRPTQEQQAEQVSHRPQPHTVYIGWNERLAKIACGCYVEREDQGTRQVLKFYHCENQLLTQLDQLAPPLHSDKEGE